MLAITCCEGIEYQCTVIDVNDERLVLRDTDAPEDDIILQRPPTAGRDLKPSAPTIESTPLPSALGSHGPERYGLGRACRVARAIAVILIGAGA